MILCRDYQKDNVLHQVIVRPQQQLVVRQQQPGVQQQQPQQLVIRPQQQAVLRPQQNGTQQIFIRYFALNLICSAFNIISP